MIALSRPNVRHCLCQRKARRLVCIAVSHLTEQGGRGEPAFDPSLDPAPVSFVQLERQGSRHARKIAECSTRLPLALGFTLAMFAIEEQRTRPLDGRFEPDRPFLAKGHDQMSATLKILQRWMALYLKRQ